MEDPYLETFLNDIFKVLYGVFMVFEFVIGFSYFCGKQLAGAIVTAALVLWDGLYEASVWGGYAIEQLVELEKFILNCVFLIYFGVCQIFEAFYITYCDLKAFLVHFADSLSTLCCDGSTAVVSSVQALVIVPEQLWAALSIVGDFGYSSLITTTSLAVDFLTQLILAPLNVLAFAGNVVLSMLAIPQLIFKDVSYSAMLGICILLALYYFCYRRIFQAVLRFIWGLVKWTWNAFGNMSSQLYCLVFRQKSVYDDDRPSSPGKPLKGICVVCHENPVVFIAQPCHHVCLCRECVRTLVDFDSRCPMCRRPVEQYERVYIS